MMQNHFTELGETTFFSTQLLSLFLKNHFIESVENYVFKKMFGRTLELREVCRTGPK